MSDQQTIRFHRRVGFNVGGEIRYVDKGDHIDLPKEITTSPFFTAVMADGLVEQFTPAANADVVNAGDALNMMEAARAEGKAEAQAEIDKAQTQAAEAMAERDTIQAALAKAQEALKKANAKARGTES